MSHFTARRWQRPRAATATPLFDPPASRNSRTSQLAARSVKDAIGHIEERIVTLGETVGPDVEITSGVVEGDVIAHEPRGRLADGRPVSLK